MSLVEMEATVGLIIIILSIVGGFVLKLAKPSTLNKLPKMSAPLMFFSRFEKLIKDVEEIKLKLESNEHEDKLEKIFKKDVITLDDFKDATEIYTTGVKEYGWNGRHDVVYQELKKKYNQK